MKTVDRDDLLNLWLKYHNTTVEEVIKKHPKEVLESPTWFALYPVTQEQYDEWVKEAKAYIKKVTKLSKRMVDYTWWSVELNCSPDVRTDKTTEEGAELSE